MMALLSLVGVQRVCADDWKGTSPSDISNATDTDSKTFYLYNVGRKQFITRGGRWGSEAVLAKKGDLGEPFTLSTSGNSYIFSSSMQMQGKTDGTKGHLTYTGSTNANDKYNYYIDQGTAITNDKFTVTGVDGGYTLQNSSMYVVGSDSIYNGSTSNSGQINGYVAPASKLGDDKSGVWMFVTLKEIKDKCKNDANNAGQAAINVSFLVKDAGFYRKDGDITNWYNGSDNKQLCNGRYSDGTYDLTPSQAAGKYSTTTYYIYTGSHKTSDGSMHTVEITETTNHGSTWTTKCGVQDEKHSFFFTSWYEETEVELTLTSTKSETTTETEGYTYYVGNGIDKDESAATNNQAAYGGVWAANIHGANGSVYQTTSETFLTGWYEVTANVFTTSTTADAVKLFASVNGATSGNGYAENSVTNGVEAPATYLVAAQRVNANTTDANGNTVYTYAVTARVYVGTANQSLKFGVKVENAGDDAWTVLDNFQIYYYGDTKNVVILDETKDDIAYMNTQNTEDAKKTHSIIYLHRSLTADKWNSIVLPFDVPAATITNVFGAGTEISEFKGAIDETHPNRLYFTKSNDIKKGKLYIIKPAIGEPTNTETVTSTADNSLTLSGSYYNFGTLDYNNDGDFSAEVAEDAVAGPSSTGNTKLQFKGTYIKKASKGAVPSGSYLIKAADQQNGSGSEGIWLYLSGSDTGKTLGFRGWLEPVSGEQGAKSVSIVVAGVEDEYFNDVTAIDGLIAQPENAINGNVYNLNGQLVRQNSTTTVGLAKGVYIVGGKKVVVK